MNKVTSIYLDFLRLMTAMVVFLMHASYPRFTGGLPMLGNLKYLGNDGVMVFFVLSGFVIAYVTDRKESRVVDYGLSRLARLYSVALPAVVLTIILDYIGSSISYNVYDGWWFECDNPIWRITANLLFINELWFSSVRLFSNGPFWSLGYEFWYYVIFGAAFYFEGRKRVFFVLAAMLLVGPKIVLLFPVWLLGVGAYRITIAATVGEALGWLLFAGSIAGYAAFQTIDGPRALLAWSTANLDFGFFGTGQKWSFAASFLNSYVVGILAAAHFIGFAAVSHRFTRILLPISGHIHYCAGFTFSIYLFHYPLLQFLTAATAGMADRGGRNAVIVFGTLAVVHALGTVTEKRKTEFKRIIITAYGIIRRGGLLRPQE